ncbi:MAG TPA: hypothetical protein VFF06_34960 [Polyangia bacterium]|nr:hypothetical protein [Polyangia bacterium]
MDDEREPIVEPRFQLPALCDAAAICAFLERAIVEDLLHAGVLDERPPAPPPPRR